jgi:RNA polymerase sigma-70 factor (ECF subfamily)
VPGRREVPTGIRFLQTVAVIDVSRLARSARGGDREALAALVRAIQADVWRFCAHLTQAEDADDLAQESLTRIVSNLPRWRGDSIMAWALGITRNVCFDHLRARARRRTDSVGEVPPAAVEAAYGDVETRQLLSSLPVEQREAIVLTQLIGMPYADAADVVGCPVGTIRSRVARGRDGLAAALRGQQRRRRV